MLQGLGAAAGPVTARAIIATASPGQALAQNMAVASGIFSIGPILAPLIGAGLVALGGDWRLVFVAMATLAGALMLTATPARDPAGAPARCAVTAGVPDQHRARLQRAKPATSCCYRAGS
ncbi:MAG: MFS transporter [Burkholderiaceae bacterium]